METGMYMPEAPKVKSRRMSRSQFKPWLGQLPPLKLLNFWQGKEASKTGNQSDQPDESYACIKRPVSLWTVGVSILVLRQSQQGVTIEARWGVPGVINGATLSFHIFTQRQGPWLPARSPASTKREGATVWYVLKASDDQLVL